MLETYRHRRRKAGHGATGRVGRHNGHTGDGTSNRIRGGHLTVGLTGASRTRAGRCSGSNGREGAGQTGQGAAS